MTLDWPQPTAASAAQVPAGVRLLRRALTIALLLVLAGCERGPDEFPWLATLDAERAEHDGKRLMALPLGLHRLDGNASHGGATVAVHGWRSRGYEWVYPLLTLADAEASPASVWFFRWDWSTCPEAAAGELVAALAGLERSAAQIRLVGHSLGGVVVVAAAAAWQTPTPLEAHAIAAPLASVAEPCAYRPPTSLPANVALHQWRTQHALDGAFKDWPTDPQMVATPGPTTRLPATYRGRRLGHNWAVSWVADRLAGNETPP